MPKPSRKQLPIDHDPVQRALFSIDKNGHPHTRIVWKYNEEDRKRQAHALRALRFLRVPMPHACGAVPGKTLLDNVKPHRGASQFYLTDISNAFGSVDQGHMREVIELEMMQYGNGKSAACRIIEDYMDDGAFMPEEPGLPQGNATSQDLFNHYMLTADSSITFMLLGKTGYRDYGKYFRYTRWLDDLTISVSEPFSLAASDRSTIRNIISEQAPGMNVSHHKSHVYSGDRPVTITGLSIYPDGRITPSPELLDTTGKLFGDLATRLVENGIVTPEDLHILDGYNGVLRLTGETAQSGSRLVRELGAESVRLREMLVPRVVGL